METKQLTIQDYLESPEIQEAVVQCITPLVAKKFQLEEASAREAILKQLG